MTGILDVSGAMEILLQKGKADKFSKVLQELILVLAPDLYVPEYPTLSITIKQKFL